MTAITSVFLYLFYATSIGSVLFFLHKVLWLVQYKRLQRSIVSGAVRDLRAGNATEIADWEDFAKQCWVSALGGADIRSAESFLHRVEEGLGQVRGDLRSNRRFLGEILRDALKTGKSSSSLAPPAGGTSGNAAPPPETVLAIRRLSRRVAEGEDSYRVQLSIRFRAIPAPRPPDKRLYELTTKSRYGFVRRALVFFSGVADVVYSSQHVALMSQNVHVPLAVLVRRLSLVILVLVVLIIDILFEIRTGIAIAMEGFLNPQNMGSREPGYLASALALGVWVAVYGSLYVALYLVIRRNYEVHRKRLRNMLAGEAKTLDQIYQRHLRELSQWGADYGKRLDDAIEINVRHAETLIDYYGDRLRRRVIGPALLDTAKLIADALFLKLPESRGELQDVATTHRHSLAHYVWPRPSEMDYQVRLAQYRAAWQDIELTIAELQRERPAPPLSHALWRSATIYATVFAPLLPVGTADRIREAYVQMVSDCVAVTDQDLGELDRRLGELVRGLHEQLDAAQALIGSRVELTGGKMQASVAALCAEIINVREQARLEGMAFEI